MAPVGQTLSPEELHVRLRQVIAEMPNLSVDSVSPQLARWLGEASFLVEDCGYIPDTVELRTEVLVVGAYAEGNLLNSFLLAVPERVPIRVLADMRALKPTLKPAVEAWGRQFGPTGPIEVRAAPRRTLHDRLILIDKGTVWLLGQSFNQLATHSNTYLSKADPELAAMKIEAYDQIWDGSAP